jgi:5-hydroxyisourate hydrolase
MSGITTHILDTSLGKPAAGVRVLLEVRRAKAWSEIGAGVTDADGRLRTLTSATIAAGTYRIGFDTGAYFAAQGVEAFYPNVTVVFVVKDTTAHYHVPLLLSPFGYSTYRGS